MLRVVVWKASPHEEEVSNRKRFRCEHNRNIRQRVDTTKDEESRVAGFHEEDIPPEGCWKGAEKESATERECLG